MEEPKKRCQYSTPIDEKLMERAEEYIKQMKPIPMSKRKLLEIALDKLMNECPTQQDFLNMLMKGQKAAA